MAGRAGSLIFTAQPVLDASGAVHGQSLVPVWGDPVLASTPANVRLGNRSNSSMIGIADPAGRTR